MIYISQGSGLVTADYHDDDRWPPPPARSVDAIAHQHIIRRPHGREAHPVGYLGLRYPSQRQHPDRLIGLIPPPDLSRLAIDWAMRRGQVVAVEGWCAVGPGVPFKPVESRP